LLPKLATGTADFAASLGLVRAGALTSKIPAHRFMQEVRVHLRRKNRVGQFHLPHFLAFQIYHIYDRHRQLPFGLVFDGLAFGGLVFRALACPVFAL
jgi:hypothetical protein